MIISCDIETAGLDARKFLIGCIVKENGVKRYFYSAYDMWDCILRLGRSLRRSGRILKVYAQNHQYDFYGYADLTDPNIKWYSETPFIASYFVDGKEAIKFLDSLAIYNMPLSRMGKIIGLNKMKTPDELIERPLEWWNRTKINRLKPYVLRDAEIVMDGIQYIKNRLKKDGYRFRTLYTSNQIAIQYFIKWLKVNDKYKDIFKYDTDGFYRRRGVFWKSENADDIHGAYRGGRVEAWKLGRYENVNYIDVNSLYGYCAMHIRFPDIRTERKIWRPLKSSKYNADSLFRKIGVSRVMVENVSNKIGVLPIRTNDGNYMPGIGKYIIGTYTHDELRVAFSEGYRLVDVEWSILWEEFKNNPFVEYINMIYNKRMASGMNKEGFNYWFYKEMQNRCFGKLAQFRINQEIFLDDVDKVQEYSKKKIIAVDLVGNKYKYVNRNPIPTKKKPYYSPIIPTLINAQGRILMYYYYKMVGIGDLVYTDTDSIIYKGNERNFNYGMGIGEFKRVRKNTNVIVYGRKTLLIGDEIKISGVRKRDVSEAEFLSGKVTSKRMIGIRGCHNISKVGSFITEERDLIKQMGNYRENISILENKNIYIDEDIENYNYFMTKLVSIT